MDYFREGEGGLAQTERIETWYQYPQLCTEEIFPLRFFLTRNTLGSFVQGLSRCPRSPLPAS